MRDSGDPVTNRLIKLKFNHEGMTTLPQTVENFDSLEVLDLTDNSITGSIPESIGKFRNLKELTLNNNMFGCYDYDFSSECSTLDWAPECCIIHCNNTDECTGGIPSTIFELENLEEINLSYNHLSSIPDSIGGLTNIEEIKLNKNRIYSELPGDIIDLQHLKTLNILHNKFYGVIPPGICSLSELSYQSLILWFHYNNFCCPYPYCVNIEYQDTSGCVTCD